MAYKDCSFTSCVPCQLSKMQYPQLLLSKCLNNSSYSLQIDSLGEVIDAKEEIDSDLRTAGEMVTRDI